jgi:hypothetical protein
MEIYKAINAIMAEVPSISKGRTNQQQGYKFRGIDDMYNALHPIMSKHCVFATSEVLSERREERTTARGGVLIYTILNVKFTFYTSDGSFIQSTMIGEGMDSGDKSANKAMSTAFKYALMQLFCIPTEDVKDSEVESHELRPTVQVTAQATVQADEKKWLNACDKQGNLTDRGKRTALALVDGRTDWDKLTADFKISKKEREALTDYVAHLKAGQPEPTTEPMEYQEELLPF